jgi:hypothetical protein
VELLAGLLKVHWVTGDGRHQAGAEELNCSSLTRIQTF